MIIWMLGQGRCFLISSKQVWMLGENVQTNFHSSSKFGFETKGLSFTYRAWSQLTRCLENLVLPHSNLLSGCDCRYMIYDSYSHDVASYVMYIIIWYNMIWNRAIYHFVSYDTIFLVLYHMIPYYIAEYFVSYDIISYHTIIVI